MISCFLSGTDIAQFLFLLTSQYSEAASLKNVSVHFNEPDTLKKANTEQVNDISMQSLSTVLVFFLGWKKLLEYPNYWGSWDTGMPHILSSDLSEAWGGKCEYFLAPLESI